MMTVKRLRIAAVLALTAAGVAAQEWSTDYEASVKKAKAEKKVVMADFTGSDWCGWCKKLKAEVFDTAEFKEWAGKNLVLVEVDFPRGKKLDEKTAKQNAELQKQYGIKGYPTLVFVDGEGKELGRSGYVPGGPKPWIEKAEAAMKGGAQDGAKKDEKADAKAGKADDKAGEGEWLEDFAAAVARAKKEKKTVIMADFTGSDWCGWCKKLKAEVFDTAEFKEWAKKNVVLLEVDFPRQKAQTAELKKKNAELQKKYKISGYPTLIFMDLDGKKIGQGGYVEGGPEAWIKAAEKAMKK